MQLSAAVCYCGLRILAYFSFILRITHFTFIHFTNHTFYFLVAIDYDFMIEIAIDYDFMIEIYKL